MTASTYVRVSAAIEAATGTALIVSPGLVVQILLGVGVAETGIAIGRVGGFGLLSLGMACWPNGDEVTVRATWVLFLYNLLASLYLCYLRVGGGFTGYVLWLAVGLHAVLAVLLARPALAAISALKTA
ncbi:MAG TPA: hypothetical protein VNX17_11790 [Edaphobacter sp.]|nr:hypothetical protein [Edaphobacter sp.]